MSMGVGSYGNPKIRDYDSGGKVTIGKYCSIADDVVMLAGGEHHIENVTSFPFDFLNGISKPQRRGVDITIGNDVWIGYGATILGGVTIFSGAVIGARAVVTKNVAPYAVVGGVPARVIHYRFTFDQIKALLAIGWWNWPEQKIKENIGLLCSPDINEFIGRYI
jgi:acetyltransferase-like isoleucine patch superfamily enzyme